MACSETKKRAQKSLSCTNNTNTPYQAPPPVTELQWPSTPVSTHTINIRLNVMNQVPKDLHTARLIIEELRSKVRLQTDHILKWRKAYAMQMQLHYRYQREKNEQLSGLTSQLLLLESRMKRKEKQIANLLNHRDITIQRKQIIIDTLSNRLIEHGLEAHEATSCITEYDALNDSDSAVVLEDMDSDNNMTLSLLRKNKNSDSAISIARSISDAIEATSLRRRNTCFLRRPDILETVYSVEEDPDSSLSSDVAEKRDKFKNRSEKALSSSSTEGAAKEISPIDSVTRSTSELKNENSTEMEPLLNSVKDETKPFIVSSILKTTAANSLDALDSEEFYLKSPLSNYNRVMTNHRSVTKPRDVKYKRINKVKSRSLEELRGRLKNMVDRGPNKDAKLKGVGHEDNTISHVAQSYA